MGKNDRGVGTMLTRDGHKSQMGSDDSATPGGEGKSWKAMVQLRHHDTGPRRKRKSNK